MSRRWKPGRKQREKIRRATETHWIFFQNLKKLMEDIHEAEAKNDKVRYSQLMELACVVQPMLGRTKQVTRRRRRAL